MDLQKKLIQLSEYRCSFKYVDSYFLISMTYPDKWSIIPSEDRSVEVAEENGITYYVAPIETDISTAFTLIENTISYNIDVEKKMALLKYNIGKLQEIFAEKDLSDLETIEFVFNTKKKTNDNVVSAKKRVRKSTKKNVKELLQDKEKDMMIGKEDSNVETPKDIDTPSSETQSIDIFSDVPTTGLLPIVGYLEPVER